MCALRGESCLTGLSNGELVGWDNDQLYKRVGFIRVLFGNEFPFFVEGLYEEKFVWG